MIEVRALTNVDGAELGRVAGGYSSHGKYEVSVDDSEGRLCFELRLVSNERPYVKTFDHFDEETVGCYRRILEGGHSFGAYDGEALVGLLIAEAHTWNRALWVHEFHVAEDYRRLGLGRRLMESAAAKAKESGLRVITCETQNTNADAVEVYRRLGFRVEGIDISLYSNADYPDGEMAIFMKRRLV